MKPRKKKIAKKSFAKKDAKNKTVFTDEKGFFGKKLYVLIFLLSLLSFISSIMVYRLHQGDALAAGVCSAIGDKSNCEEVGSSSYSKLFGFDNSIIGIIGFALMMFLAANLYLKHSHLYEKTIFLGAIISSTLAVYFIYLQAFVIKAYCTYCLIVDFSSIAMLILLVIKLLLKK